MAAAPLISITDEGEYNFFEARCLNTDCFAILELGETKETKRLYPKRKDSDGKFLPNDGWSVWQPDESSHASAAAGDSGQPSNNTAGDSSQHSAKRQGDLIDDHHDIPF